MLTRPLDPRSIAVLRAAGRTQLIARLTSLIGCGAITCRQAARMLAAYREQVQEVGPC